MIFLKVVCLLSLVAFVAVKADTPPAGVALGSKLGESFDSLTGKDGSSSPLVQGETLPGWWANQDSYMTSDGSSNVGGLYSFGEVGSSDRALGSITSNKKKNIFFGVSIVSARGVDELQISFDAQQWRYGGDIPDTDSMTFDYSVMTTSQYNQGGWGALGETTLWTSVPVLAIFGNASNENFTVGPVRYSKHVNYTLKFPTSFGGDKVLQLRWSDHSGRDGLAINNFQAVPTSLGPELPSGTPITNIWQILAITAFIVTVLTVIALVAVVIKLRQAHKLRHEAIPQPELPTGPITNIGPYGLWAQTKLGSPSNSSSFVGADVENQPLLSNNSG